MALIDDLSTALKEAMKAKDKPKLDAIRQVQTEIAKKKAEKGEEATDALVLNVISSYVKKMIKAVEEYNSLGDRGVEMASKIQYEIDYLKGSLISYQTDCCMLSHYFASAMQHLQRHRCPISQEV